jgi:hypothetical protein
MIFDLMVFILVAQIVAAAALKIAMMWSPAAPAPVRIKLDAREEPVVDGRYDWDWSAERAALLGKTAREQRKILAPWISATVESMHCTTKDAERFFRINLVDVLN